MKTYQWIIILAVVWLGLVVRNIPAEWGIWLADTPARMAGVSGTVWSGSAARVVLPYAGGGMYDLGELDWELKPLSLLTLKPCADIAANLESQQIAGTACGSLSGAMQLADVEINLPAAAAEMWAPVSVRGDVFLQIDRLRIADNQIQTLNGKGSWSNARYHNSQQWMNLGTIAFEMTEDGNGGLAADVFDIKGPMKLDLDSQFSLDGSFEIRGDIVLRDNAPREINQLLMIVAEEIKKGHYRFEWVSS